MKARQAERHRQRGSFYSCRQGAEQRRELVSRVARVAGEEFVAALAGEDHLHVTARQLGHHVVGERRGIGDRLIEMPHDFLGLLYEILAANDDLVMVGAVPLGHEPRVRQLAERCTVAVEAD